METLMNFKDSNFAWILLKQNEVSMCLKFNHNQNCSWKTWTYSCPQILRRQQSVLEGIYEAWNKMLAFYITTVLPVSLLTSCIQLKDERIMNYYASPLILLYFWSASFLKTIYNIIQVILLFLNWSDMADTYSFLP